MYRLIHLLMGSLYLKLEGEGVLDAVMQVTAEGMHLGGFLPTEEGYEGTCSVFGADRLIARLGELGVSVTVQGKRGLPFKAMAYLRRPGLMLGLGLALMLIFGATRLIWEVRPHCDAPIDEEKVLSELKSLGVYAGANLYDIDVYEAEQRFLINNSEFSDIAINIQGLVATVKLRVRTDIEHGETKTAPCNIVASEAGVIRKITATKGEPAVKKGDTVAEGDLLISGEVIGKHGASYLYPASGSVTALVYREYTVIIPLETTEKHYTGRTETKTLYSVLGTELTLFKKEESGYRYADAESSTEKISVLGQKLPIVKEAVTFKEYVLSPLTLTVSEAEERAVSAFDAYLERELDGEVLSRRFDCAYNEELKAVVLSGIAEVALEIGTAVDIEAHS